MTKSIIVALDEYDQIKFDKVLDQLDPNLCMVKVGSVSFNSLGRESVLKAASKGFDIFLDLKLHDIPNTVKKSLEGLNANPVETTRVNQITKTNKPTEKASITPTKKFSTSPTY